MCFPYRKIATVQRGQAAPMTVIFYMGPMMKPNRLHHFKRPCKHGGQERQPKGQYRSPLKEQTLHPHQEECLTLLLKHQVRNFCLNLVSLSLDKTLVLNLIFCCCFLYSSIKTHMSQCTTKPTIRHATSEDSDQTTHLRSLIRVFADGMCLLQSRSYHKRD